MTLYCYFIARSQRTVEALPYPLLQGAPLVFVRHEELAAAVRRLPVGSRVKPEWMLDYNAVLAAVSKYATVLPARLGAGFRDEGAIIRFLATRRNELTEALDRLQGKAEMSLRIEIEPGEKPADQAARLGQICGALDARFAVLSTPGGRSLLELAHLIERSDAGPYRERAKPYAREVSGPWPPLHFLPEFLRRPVKSELGHARRTASRQNS